MERRANGESYAKIAEALKISKSTCHEWETAMRAEIAVTKSEALASVYDEYGLHKAARIRRLGRTLQRLDEAIDQIDLSKIPPDKLLGLKLKYAEALREEYTGAEEPLPIGGSRASKDSIFYLLSGLLDRVRSGEASPQQARIEMDAIGKMTRAYEAATTIDLASAFYSPEALKEPTDIYTQMQEESKASRRAEAAADRGLEPSEADAARAAAPTLSQDTAVAALKAQLGKLIENGDVDGLAKFLTLYSDLEAEEADAAEEDETE